MTPAAHPEPYKHHRFPGEIISPGVWRASRFTLSYRDVQELLLARGIAVTYEAIRQLKSDGAAKRELLPGVEQRQSRYLNTRCEPSQRPTRQRERHRQGFTSPGHAPRLLSSDERITQPFRPRRYRLSASDSREVMRHRCEQWANMTGTERAIYQVGRTGEEHPGA
jgi:transposase-like protein